MPATQHCGLEAAGLIAAHGEHGGNATCCETSTPCSHDGCEIVEGVAFKPTLDSLQVSAPDLVACTCFLCLQLVYRDLSAEPVTPVVAVEESQAWVPVWHFVRRAAPLSRAPSILV
jgi:hypothetical protein